MNKDEMKQQRNRQKQTASVADLGVRATDSVNGGANVADLGVRATGEDTGMTAEHKLKIIRDAIELTEKRIAAKKITVSMSDLIRLLEKEAEISGRDARRKVTIAWVDASKKPILPPENDGYTATILK